MGFLKNIGKWFGKTKQAPQPPRRGVVPAAPQKETQEDREAAELLRGLDAEEKKIFAGEIIDVVSSNVAWFQYADAEQSMTVGFDKRDGTGLSVYKYWEISRDEVLEFWRAGSHGGKVWDMLRVRGTVFGFQKPYEFLSGVSTAKRVWHEGVPGARNKKGQYITKAQAGLESRQRHGAIPASGEPYKGYHPATAFGKGGLGKKRGKRGKKSP